MTYILANIDGRAALVADDRCHDLESVSDGELASDPMAATAPPASTASAPSPTAASARPTTASADQACDLRIPPRKDVHR